MKVGDKTFKVHLDGYDLTDALAGKTPSPRHEFFYFNDRGNLAAVRYDQYKIAFQEQRAEGVEAWQEDYSMLSIPKLYNLRADPFEEADHSADYWQWRVDHMFIMVPVQELDRELHGHVQGIPAEPEGGQLDEVMANLSSGSAGAK
jgi:arylsulfatase